MKRHLLTLAFLLVGAPTLATPPPPCQGRAPQRNTWPNGTLLWSTTPKVADNMTSSMLVSLELGHVQHDGAALKDVRLEDGCLVAPSQAPEGLAGAMLQGTATDGQSVQVAICCSATTTPPE